MIVEQPVEEGIPETVAECKPSGQKVQSGWSPSARACGDHFLYGPRRYEHYEAQGHRCHRPGCGRTQSTLLRYQLETSEREELINNVIYCNAR